MKRNRINTTFVSSRLLLAAGIIMFFSMSCLRRTEKNEFKNLIPERDFVSILYDLHLSNGMLALPEKRTRYVEQDTSGLYVEIIEGYGYRTGQLDTTLQYYYIRKPKKLIQIYDQMLGRISELDARLEHRNINAPDDAGGQWTGNPFYFMPFRDETEKPWFEITLASPGTYSLTFSVTVFPDDQSDNPGFTAWLCDADSSATGRKKFLPFIGYIKDGQPHFYTITGMHTGFRSNVLKGCLYDSSNNPGTGEPNAVISDISFYFSGRLK